VRHRGATRRDVWSIRCSSDVPRACPGLRNLTHPGNTKTHTYLWFFCGGLSDLFAARMLVRRSHHGFASVLSGVGGGSPIRLAPPAPISYCQTPSAHHLNRPRRPRATPNTRLVSGSTTSSCGRSSGDAHGPTLVGATGTLSLRVRHLLLFGFLRVMPPTRFRGR